MDNVEYSNVVQVAFESDPAVTYVSLGLESLRVTTGHVDISDFLHGLENLYPLQESEIEDQENALDD